MNMFSLVGQELQWLNLDEKVISDQSQFSVKSFAKASAFSPEMALYQ